MGQILYKSPGHRKNGVNEFSGRSGRAEQGRHRAIRAHLSLPLRLLHRRPDYSFRPFLPIAGLGCCRFLVRHRRFPPVFYRLRPVRRKI